MKWTYGSKSSQVSYEMWSKNYLIPSAVKRLFKKFRETRLSDSTQNVVKNWKFREDFYRVFSRKVCFFTLAKCNGLNSSSLLTTISEERTLNEFWNNKKRILIVLKKLSSAMRFFFILIALFNKLVAFEL